MSLLLYIALKHKLSSKNELEVLPTLQQTQNLTMHARAIIP